MRTVDGQRSGAFGATFGRAVVAPGKTGQGQRLSAARPAVDCIDALQDYGPDEPVPAGRVNLPPAFAPLNVHCAAPAQPSRNPRAGLRPPSDRPPNTRVRAAEKRRPTTGRQSPVSISQSIAATVTITGRQDVTITATEVGQGSHISVIAGIVMVILYDIASAMIVLRGMAALVDLVKHGYDRHADRMLVKVGNVTWTVTDAPAYESMREAHVKIDKLARMVLPESCTPAPRRRR